MKRKTSRLAEVQVAGALSQAAAPFLPALGPRPTFIAPQTVTGHEPLTQFLTSVREIEQQTGLDFYPDLPREVQDRMESAKAERLW